MHIVISIIAYIVAIGVLVTVHEFGHFIVARRLGIKVLRFSIGFGRPLLTWHRRGDSTEYVIAALPLGGYVKMADEREGGVAEEDLPHAFNRQPLLTRLAVVLAGPAFNFAFAAAAFWIIFIVGIPGLKPIVGDIKPGSPAALAGFAPQDQLLAVAGRDTATWDTAVLALFQGVMEGGPVPVEVRSADGQERQRVLQIHDAKQLTEPGELLTGLGLSPWDPPIPPVIAELVPDGSAAASGLRAGDRVLSLGGQAVANWQLLVPLLQQSPGKTLPMVVERGGHPVTLALHIAAQPTSGGALIGHIGARPVIPPDREGKIVAEQRYNPAAAFWQALQRTADLSWLTLDAAWNMVLGKVSWHNLSGPIDIAQYAGDTAQSGLVPFLAFLAIVSISLGVMNLLPIPVLDGGQVLYFAVEFVKRSPLSERTELMGQRIGLALLVTLMGFAVYNDILRNLS